MKVLLSRLWTNLIAKRKRQLFLILLLMLLTSIAEVVSIGAVVPFLAVLANPEGIVKNDIVFSFMQYFNLTNASQLLLLFTIAFVTAAIIAGLMRVALLWSQARFSNAVGTDLSYKAYKLTLYQPYSVHISKNSSEVIAGITSKINIVVSSILSPILIGASSAVMLTMIMLTLVIISPYIAISIIIGFSFVYIVFIVLTRKKLISNSNNISNKSGELIKILQEGLGGIRDIKIDGTENAFCSLFRNADMIMRRSKANNQIMAQAPRFIVESVGIVVIVLIAYSFSDSKEGITNTLPILGALALGAQRMLPMIQSAYGAWSNMKGSYKALEDVVNMIEQVIPCDKNHNNMAIPFNYEIRLKNVHYRYNDDTSWVLNNVNISIKKGEKVGIIGKTGSGKSTLVDIIMGLLQPSIGEILVDDSKVLGSSREWQAHIAHIPQSIFLTDATISENIAFGVAKDKIDICRVKKVAKIAQISKIIDSWNDKYETVVGERGVQLSGGQRQRIGIARALYKKADILILDEATSALDNKTENLVITGIENNKENATIIMVAHRHSTLKNCDKIIVMDDGVVVNAGAYSEASRFFN